MQTLKERNKIALAYQKEVGLWFNENGFCARRVTDTRDNLAIHEGAVIGQPQPCDWTVFKYGLALNIEVKVVFTEKPRLKMSRTCKSQLGLMAFEAVHGEVPGYFIVFHIPEYKTYAVPIGAVADRKYASYFELTDDFDISSWGLEWFRDKFEDKRRWYK